MLLLDTDFDQAYLLVVGLPILIGVVAIRAFLYQRHAACATCRARGIAELHGSPSGPSP